MVKKSAENEWMELVKTAFWAVLLATCIRTVALEPFNIPSGSMKPGLIVGDYLFVSKYTYGYSKYSAPMGLSSFIEGRIWGARPEQGDVVVFKNPVNNREDYIKRVIGMPGDTIQMKIGQLFLNGEAVPREFITTHEMTNGAGRILDAYEYKQTLPNGVSFSIFEYGDNGPHDNTRIFTIPDGHYFVMGDNRDDSSDSRAEIGFIPYENLVGRAEFLFFSTNGYARLWEFWKWPWTIRYDRLFNGIT